MEAMQVVEWDLAGFVSGKRRQVLLCAVFLIHKLEDDFDDSKRNSPFGGMALS